MQKQKANFVKCNFRTLSIFIFPLFVFMKICYQKCLTFQWQIILFCWNCQFDKRGKYTRLVSSYLFPWFCKPYFSLSLNWIVSTEKKRLSAFFPCWCDVVDAVVESGSTTWFSFGGRNKLQSRFGGRKKLQSRFGGRKKLQSREKQFNLTFFL